ncbi:thioesterase family protein [Arthrobacter sp. Br18]|uniref:acyl-CoA thioesterase n=1 Tax=Arthrobacter sp. Br18 TaxID=1312954 RepID=UPI00047E64F3|nr:thioesterase family protein [Arthrobacter sp. Br18]
MAPMLTVPLQLRFGDEDSYGHVNNARFVQFLEDARVRLLSESGGGSTFLQVSDPGHYTLVGRHEIEYLAPLNFSTEPAGVDVWITAVGSSSFTLGYAVRDTDASDAGITCAVASTTMILVDRQSGRPVRLSAAQRTALDQWTGAGVPFRRPRGA